MEQKKSKIFNSRNINAIEEYCKLNNIVDVDEFTYQCFKQGFDVKKYGFLGKTLNEDEKDLKTDEIGEKDLRDSRKTCGIEEKRAGIEVIREKRAEKEVIQTVEVIKEVEKIVEVEVIKYVDKEIIKEVPVEKIVTKIEYISNKTGENELLLKIQQLNENIFHLNQELDKERQIFSTKTTEMENIFQNKMSKKDEELEKLKQKLDITVDDDKLKMLSETLLKLRKDLSLKDKRIEEMEGINKQLENGKVSQNATYLNGSNIIRRL
jgi:hypothetical protein